MPDLILPWPQGPRRYPLPLTPGNRGTAQPPPPSARPGSQGLARSLSLTGKPPAEEEALNTTTAGTPIIFDLGTARLRTVWVINSVIIQFREIRVNGNGIAKTPATFGAVFVLLLDGNLPLGQLSTPNYTSGPEGQAKNFGAFLDELQFNSNPIIPPGHQAALELNTFLFEGNAGNLKLKQGQVILNYDIRQV